MILTDTFYNTPGQVKTTHRAHHHLPTHAPTHPPPAPTRPRPRRVAPPRGETRRAPLSGGAGGGVASIFQPAGLESWRPPPAYGGDRVDVPPPAGGTATSTVTDARGRT